MLNWFICEIFYYSVSIDNFVANVNICLCYWYFIPTVYSMNYRTFKNTTFLHEPKRFMAKGLLNKQK